MFVTDYCKKCNRMAEFYARVRSRAACVVCLRLQKHGLTRDEYETMVREHGDRCGICGTTEPGGKAKDTWKVDHDHETGINRGLLCNNCNLALGLLKHSVENLAKAVVYMNRHQAKAKALEEAKARRRAEDEALEKRVTMGLINQRYDT